MQNFSRSGLAKGEQEDPLGVNGFAPKAARMRKMVWDCEIEYNSQKHASSCQYDHSPPSERPTLGQNLYFTEQLTLGVALAASQDLHAITDYVWRAEQVAWLVSLYGRPKKQHLE
ncbi:SCP-like protein [Ancylostoma duodenale]|uniref:SCP-like protein n=1 Tax=Ancylostoma duodenale TaxID=51022 RepID=A0A0C2C4V3_9BILA|nr:SCP-like protein [Ancylostoma duodenale]